jgi:tRNA threonylcarbamoyladenosine biosynthesis protein TsaB
MITLAIDTSEARGSVALSKDGAALAVMTHEDATDYSVWLLPAVDGALSQAATKMEWIDLLAVSTGPGSFTGLRVGLTTVKAWAEVYGTRIVGISRLEAMARSREADSGFVTACYDAHRGQLFAGLYRRSSSSLQRVGDELVIAPEDLIRLIDEQAGKEPVTWISLDRDLIVNLEAMKRRIAAGDKIVPVSPELAPIIGRLAEENAAKGQFSDPLALDANYVRRSDAEIFWKSMSSGVR